MPLLQEARVSPFSEKPVLVFWEMTRACFLACAHCRASALREPLPGELTHDEGMRLVQQVASFGGAPPALILTGGDPLMRQDFFELLSYATSLGVRSAVSPAVTELLTYDALRRIKDAGAVSMSISLDGASAEVHDSIRGRAGTYKRTIQAISEAVGLGLNPQVNTTIMRRNYAELPRLFHLIRSLGVKAWELFFLVRVGRGSAVDDLSPAETESVCNFLYDASLYGTVIRCVEGPFIRRVLKNRQSQGECWSDGTYLKLKAELLELCGPPVAPTTLGARGTLDGDGIVFVGYDGTIQPGGLVPVAVGDVRKTSLAGTYRHNQLLTAIRARRFSGACGTCEFRDACGGSRARAYAYHGDVLASDPACLQTLLRRP